MRCGVARAGVAVAVAVQLLVAETVAHAAMIEEPATADTPTTDDPPTPSDVAPAGDPTSTSDAPATTGAPPPTDTATTDPPPTTPDAGAAEPTILLHLESTKPGAKLELFQVTEETSSDGPGGGVLSFRRMCAAPCDLRLPAHAEYFLSAGKNTQSRNFTIEGHGDAVTVRARPGSRAAVIVGEVFIALGCLMIVSGVGLLVAGKVLDRKPFVNAGGGLLGGGLGGLAIGIPLQLTAGKTRVREITRSAR